MIYLGFFNFFIKVTKKLEKIILKLNNLKKKKKLKIDLKNFMLLKKKN